jgi:hypothetical protein
MELPDPQLQRDEQKTKRAGRLGDRPATGTRSCELVERFLGCGRGDFSTDGSYRFLAVFFLAVFFFVVFLAAFFFAMTRLLLNR